MTDIVFCAPSEFLQQAEGVSLVTLSLLVGESPPLQTFAHDGPVATVLELDSPVPEEDLC